MVLHKSGKTSVEADALLKINWDWKLTSEAVTVICNTAMSGCNPLAKICAHTMKLVPSFLVASGIAPLATEKAMPKQMTAADLAKAQMQDWDLNQIICLHKARQ